jgi:beta-fructofuranosidase
MTTPDPHRPHFHFTSPRHWINDPNGLCFHAGRYHLFYQHNPGASHWGDMHWGHATSADLVTWRDEPIALAPTPGYHDEGGCFSGSFAVVAGLPTLYYTGYKPSGQVQCVATADPADPTLGHWTKHPERTIEHAPEGVTPQDFRDPYVFERDGGWFMVVGASIRSERGQVLLYRSDDGVHWTCRGPLYTSPNLSLGVMWECPNFFRVDGPDGERWVLTVSVWPLLGAHAFVGHFDGERFTPEWDGPMDPDGGAFAQLTMRAPDGRILQWGWMNEARDQPLIDADGWAGAMSVPRELGVDAQNRLTQRPAVEIEQLREGPLAVTATGIRRGTTATTTHTFAGRHLDLQATFTLRDRQKVGLTLLGAADGSEVTRVVFWPDARRLLIERERSSATPGTRRQNVHSLLVLPDGEPLRLRVLVDASVIEVYAQDRLCLSTRVYPAETSLLGTAFVEGDATVELQAWAMGSIYAGFSGRTPRPCP